MPATPSSAAPAVSPPAPGAGEWNLEQLERLVAQRGAAHPDRVDEWKGYLLYLRDYAAPDGSLSANFDSLVWEVFEDLLER